MNTHLPPLLHPRRAFLKNLALGSLVFASARWNLGAAEPSPEKRLGVVLVGLGSYSTHQLAPAILKSKYCRIAGVVTGDRRKGLKWAKDFGFPEANVFGYDTMDRMKGNPDIDVVYVVTPNGLHAAHCIAAAKAGKHVICEKPMANTVAECDAIIAACMEAKVRLMVGYRLHYEPRTQEFIRLAKEQEVGPLLQMESDNGWRIWDQARPETFWRLDGKLAGGGPLMDMGVYVIQAVCMAKGEALPVAIEARIDATDRPAIFSQVEESIHWTMEFADGAKATCHASYGENISHFSGTGPKGWIKLGGNAFGYASPEVSSSRGEFKIPTVNHQLVQMDGMAREILDGKPSLAPGEMGRRDMVIVEAIYASAAAKGKRIVLGA